jgi:hypothetical protein
VLEYLPYGDLCYIPSVCWDLHVASTDDIFWKKLYLLHFHVVILSHRDEGGSWRMRYWERKNMVDAKGMDIKSFFLILQHPQYYIMSIF